MKNKKQKLLVGICAPIAILGTTAGAIGLILAAQNSPVSPIDKTAKATITFDAGEGKITKGPKTSKVPYGKTLSDAEQPTVSAKGKVFAGWKNQFGEIQENRAVIRNNTKLTAVYNGDSDEYAIIHFKNYQSDIEGSVECAKLKGNATLSIPKGHHFYMANRPEAVATDGATKTYTFKGWKYGESVDGHVKGDTVAENDIIRDDTVLVPYFTAAVTITYDHTDPEIEIISGNDKQVGEQGDEFGNFNQPGISKKSGGTALYFIGWFDEAIPLEPTQEWLDQHRMLKTRTIEDDMTVYPYFGSKVDPGEEYCLITFDKTPDERHGIELPEGDEWHVDPTGEVLTTRETRWGDVFKPTVYDTQHYYKQAGWEYQDSDGNWQTLYDDDIITYDQTVTVKPLMVSTVDYASVTGKQYLLPGQTADYTLVVEGAEASKGTVEWHLINAWTGEKPDETIAKIDQNGHLEIFGKLEDSLALEVSATFTLPGNTITTDPLYIWVNQPYQDSKNIWFHDNNDWYQIYASDLSSKTSSQVKFYDVDGKQAGTLDKESSFDKTLIFGSLIRKVNDNFMFGWTGFTGKVDLKFVEYIGDNFMYGCSAFTGGDESFSSPYVRQIGNNFLAHTGWNNNILLGGNNQLTYIGSDFLAYCEKFDCEIELPYTADLEIMDHFMHKCTGFTGHNVIIPSNVKYIGDYFMHNCDNFNGYIQVEYGFDPDSAFTGTTYDFSTSNESAQTLSDGFEFTVMDPMEFRQAEQPTADQKQALLDKLNTRYPTLDTKATVAWRKNKGTKIPTMTQEQFDTALKTLNKMLSANGCGWANTIDYTEGSAPSFSNSYNVTYAMNANGLLDQGWAYGDAIGTDVLEHQISNGAVGKYNTVYDSELQQTVGYINTLYANATDSYVMKALSLASFFNNSKYRDIDTWTVQSFEQIGQVYMASTGQKDHYYYFQVSSDFEEPTISGFGTALVTSEGGKKSYSLTDFTLDLQAFPMMKEISFKDVQEASVVTTDQKWTFTTTEEMDEKRPLFLSVTLDAKAAAEAHYFDLSAKTDSSAEAKVIVLKSYNEGANTPKWYYTADKYTNARSMNQGNSWAEKVESNFYVRSQISGIAQDGNITFIVEVVPDSAIKPGAVVTIEYKNSI